MSAKAASKKAAKTPAKTAKAAKKAAPKAKAEAAPKPKVALTPVDGSARPFGRSDAIQGKGVPQPTGDWDDSLGDYLHSEEPMALGFMRLVKYVQERRRQGWEDVRILEVARQFVANYPRAFPDVDGEFYSGMKASLTSFKAQVEQQELRGLRVF